MGLLKIIRHTDGGYNYMNNALNYVAFGKASYDCVGSPNVSLHCPHEQFHAVKQYFDKRSGNPLFHFIVVYHSRSAYDVEQAKALSRVIASFFAERYQIIWCVHHKPMSSKYGGVSSMYHAHFVMNSVSYVDGRMYRGDYAETYRFLDYIKRITKDPSWTVTYGTDKDAEIASNEL